ncbi:hypothetical protein FKP32DRAFT_1684178 [Trametes sanguinea]|nr:hypothetical protein FKP32DRAFT_1684178 [Trametes sanguinea]
MHHLSSASSSAVRRQATRAANPVLARGAHKEIKFSNEGRAAILQGVDVLANAVVNTALAACIVNKLRGQPQVCAVNAPGFGRKSSAGGAVFTGEGTADVLAATGSRAFCEDSVCAGGVVIDISKHHL